VVLSGSADDLAAGEEVLSLDPPPRQDIAGQTCRQLDRLCLQWARTNGPTRPILHSGCPERGTYRALKICGGPNGGQAVARLLGCWGPGGENGEAFAVRRCAACFGSGNGDARTKWKLQGINNASAT
jgi:hypothetical protein